MNNNSSNNNNLSNNDDRASKFNDLFSGMSSQFTGNQEVQDIDLGNIDIVNDANQYARNTTPVGGVKVVTKEVIKTVGNVHASVNTINNVYTGRSHRVILVTGDRGTGITTTALSMAKYLSNKVSVLYFDVDTDNHGLLSYIDYNMYRNFDTIHMEGIKRCRDKNAFYSCVVNYDNNFDILTTDYSCDTRDEEIDLAQSVVSEFVNEYGVVVVDCPVSKIHLVADMIMSSSTVICVEASKRGFMNMLCQFENSGLENKYKRTLGFKSTIFLTKNMKDVNINSVINSVKELYQPDDVDWMDIAMYPFFGKLNDKILSTILEK